MKTCPNCHTQFPDQFAFCQKDGTPLNEVVQPPPPSFAALATQPVVRAVPLGQVTNRIEIATQQVEPIFTAQVAQPANSSAAPQTTTAPGADAFVEPASSSQQTPSRWPWVLLVMVILLAGAGAIGYYFVSNVTQSRFANAVEEGHLVTPAGKSAYDYFLQLKQEGKTPEQLAQLAQPLLPQLATKPQQLFADIAATDKRDTTPEAWDEAQRMLVWASELSPTDKRLTAQASYATGRAAYLRGKKDEALGWWKKAYEQDKTWFLPANGLGIIYNERKNYVAARTVLQEAIKREPNSALPYNNLGTAWLLAKDDTQAETNYRKAIELEPNWPRPHAWLGEIAMRRKDYATAVQEFELVLSLGATTDTSIDANKIRIQLEQARKFLQEQPIIAPLPPTAQPPPN